MCRLGIAVSLAVVFALSGAHADLILSPGTEIVFGDASTQSVAATGGGETAPGHGGTNNTLSGTDAYVGGGNGNSVTGDYGAISGGQGNKVTDARGFVGGGAGNQAGDNAGNTSDVQFATVGGGNGNFATGGQSTIGGGYSNVASGIYTTVGGGSGNVASGQYAAIAGGSGNLASGDNTFVGGGTSNDATAVGAIVIGGNNNNATNSYATVLGGNGNDVSGIYGTIVGGNGNDVVGSNGVAIGGSGNWAATQAFAAGTSAQASYQGSWVWADASGTPASISSTSNNQFIARALGGFIFWSTWNGTQLSGARLNNGDTAWSVASDKNLKENFTDVDGEEVLDKLAQMPVKIFNYIGADTANRHMGVMAQDFHGSFDLGSDDLSITTQDADGVTIAAIQGLNTRLQRAQNELDAKQTQIESLEARLAALEAALADK